MRHPFDGVIPADGETPAGLAPNRDIPAGEAEGPSSRRFFLGAAAAVLGAAAGLLSSREASAQRGVVTTQALGEEGGRPRPIPPGHGGTPPGLGGALPPGQGGPPRGRGGRVTTLAIGEEGGRGGSPRR